MILEKRIPTVLAMIIIMAGIFGAVNLASKQTQTIIKANPAAQIKEVALSNVSDTGFTISWLTDGDFGQYAVIPESSKKNFCLPEYGSSSGPCYLDDRDIETNTPSKNKTHHVAVDGLSANSKYTVKIYTSGDASAKTFKEIDGMPITTGPAIDGALSNAVIYGNFFSSDGKQPIAGALIYLISDKGSKISTISKPSGAWLLTLNKLRSQMGENEPFMLEVKTGSGAKTEIKTTVSLSQPLTNINIGSQELFDFSTNTVIPTLAPTVSVTGSKKTGFAVPTPNTIGGNVPLSLINPSENSSVDNLPTFRGTADPGQMVTIEVNSETPINAEVKTDENGNWFWTPPSNLTPGEHTVTITVIDKNGNRQMVTKTFTVLANVNTLPVTAGSESAQIATPTPELTPEPTPKPTTEPTPEPTLTPSLEPTPRVVNQEVPVTASPLPLIILLTSGMVFATMGLWMKKVLSVVFIFFLFLNISSAVLAQTASPSAATKTSMPTVAPVTVNNVLTSMPKVSFVILIIVLLLLAVELFVLKKRKSEEESVPIKVEVSGDNKKAKTILTFLILLFILVAIPLTLILVKQRQEVRKKAVEPTVCCEVWAKNFCSLSPGSLDLKVKEFSTEAQCNAYKQNPSPETYSCNCTETCTTLDSNLQENHDGNQVCTEGPQVNRDWGKSKCTTSGSDNFVVRIVNQAACGGVTTPAPTAPPTTAPTSPPTTAPTNPPTTAPTAPPTTAPTSPPTTAPTNPPTTLSCNQGPCNVGGTSCATGLVCIHDTWFGHDQWVCRTNDCQIESDCICKQAVSTPQPPPPAGGPGQTAKPFVPANAPAPTQTALTPVIPQAGIDGPTFMTVVVGALFLIAGLVLAL